jgi:hypothetical protein
VGRVLASAINPPPPASVGLHFYSCFWLFGSLGGGGDNLRPPLAEDGSAGRDAATALVVVVNPRLEAGGELVLPVKHLHIRRDLGLRCAVAARLRRWKHAANDAAALDVLLVRNRTAAVQKPANQLVVVHGASLDSQTVAGVLGVRHASRAEIHAAAHPLRRLLVEDAFTAAHDLVTGAQRENLDVAVQVAFERRALKPDRFSLDSFKG